MAATPSGKKKVMDVAKPGKTAPSATTRPLIVNHSGSIIDPSINDDVKSAPVPSEDALNGKNGITLTKPRGPKVLQPLSAAQPEETEQEQSTDSEIKMPALPIETTEETSNPAEEPAPEAEKDPVDQDAQPSDVSEEESPAVPDETPSEASDAAPAETATNEPASKDDDAQGKNEASDDAKDNADDDSENAAIVDAVVDQANIGKKQKEEDKELLARKELINKLADEKKYFIPIKQKNTTRSGRMTMVLGILGLLVILGGYAAVDMGMINPGFDVPFHILGKKEAVKTALVTPAATPVANTATPTQPTTPATTPATLDYTNKELGVSFSYPSAWGDVAVKKQSGSISGNSVTFTFSKQPLLAAGMLSRDYKENGRDGVCYLLLGILPPSTFDTVSSAVKEGDLVIDTQSLYKGTTRILKKTTDTLIYEQFETGPSTNTDACLGLSTVGYVAFKSSAPYTGIQFYWGGDASTRKVVPVSELATYKADPNKYLDDAVRKSFITMVESAKSQ